MLSKYKELLSNTAIFAISNILSKLILSLLLPLYTRTLSTEMYGRAEIITTIADLIIPICSFAIQDALFRYSMEKERKELVLKNSLLVLIMATGILFVVANGLRLYSGVGSLYMVFWSVSSIMMWRSALSLYSKATNNTMVFAIDNVLYNILLCAFNILFLVIFKLELIGYFSAMIAAGISSCVYLTINTNSFRIFIKTRFDFSFLKEMLRYSCPLIFNSISWGLTHIVDKLMLSDMCGYGATGIYSAASKIPSLLSLVTGTFTQAWALSAIKDYQTDRDTKFYKNIFNITHIGVCLGALAVLIFNNNLFLLILGVDFADSIKYVPVLLIGTVFLTYANFYSPIFSAMKKSSGIMYSSVGGAVINILLNALLIPHLGIMGACLATAASYFFTAEYRMLNCKRMFPLSISYVKWWISLVALIGAAYFTIMSKYYLFIIIIALLFLGLLYRNIIVEYYKQVKRVMCNFVK